MLIYHHNTYICLSYYYTLKTNLLIRLHERNEINRFMEWENVAQLYEMLPLAAIAVLYAHLLKRTM